VGRRAGTATWLVFLAADDRRKEELDEAVREFLSWGYIVQRATELDLSPNQLQMASTRRKKADEVIGQRIGATYIWVIMPEQPDFRAPAELRPIKVEGQSAELVERVSDRLRREGALQRCTRHKTFASTSMVRWLAFGMATSRVGDLWQHYTAHPYLPRLRDRTVLDDGVLAVLGSFTWEMDGFALASGYDETTGRYIGLVIPHQDSLGFVTDAVLLVDPETALRQRRKNTYSQQASAGGNDVVVTESSPGTFTLTGDPIGTPAPPSKRTRFFGVVEIDSRATGASSRGSSRRSSRIWWPRRRARCALRWNSMPPDRTVSAMTLCERSRKTPGCCGSIGRILSNLSAMRRPPSEGLAITVATD
jgi:hypothetical protein